MPAVAAVAGAVNPKNKNARIRLYEKLYDIPDDIIQIPHPIIGFTGKIDRMKIDLDLIRYLVENRSEWSVVLVGPVSPDIQRIINWWIK